MEKHQFDPSLIPPLGSLLNMMRRSTRPDPKRVHAGRPSTSPKVRAKRRKRTKMAKLSRRANR